MINSGFLQVGTKFKEETGKVTVITPNGVHHDIKDTNLEKVATSLRSNGYDFTYLNTTMLEITELPQATAAQASVQAIASL